ncbi:hypothetical protein KEM09_02570 [Carboxylicivirga mesophila]|uniref:Replication-associated protein G2P N-terminal domain-containing protein n=1 Tax=Carboxylicivirga mesophila TaxID=1166478 RepID=A0ABS5K6V6_9BACT|nr:phage/plasmid replication protein [Carboxylicivirga mesophila]MBS2210263.1 hypothetical protein [Carboxylicivirga mesophila]
MFDSIGLRIHNLQKNQRLVDILESSKTADKVYEHQNPFADYVDTETGEIHSSNQSKYLQLKSIHYGDSGKQLTFFKDKKLTSSHYYLGYQVRLDRDYIEFNYSIPKYIFGTNIVQFVPHITEFKNSYGRAHLESMERIQAIIYDRLIFFVKYFLKMQFPLIDSFGWIDLNDVEINRLDICFNQYFESKEKALKYLEYQKRIKKRYLRETSKNKTDWGTSIFLNTGRYAAKIYHKGTEYGSSKGERNHHRKMNKAFKRNLFQVEDVYDTKGKLIKEGLQSHADKILRYEISFKNSMMSHLYRKDVFAKYCIVRKQLEKSYKKVRKIKKRCDRLIEKGAKDPNKELRTLTKEEITEAKIYEKILNKKVSFRLAVGKNTIQNNESLVNLKYSSKGDISLPMETLFSKALVKEMFNVFNDFLQQFKIDVQEKFTDVTKRVMNYNKNVDAYNEHFADYNKKGKQSKINMNKINSILAHLQYHTLDELVKMGIISRSGKYDIKSRLEKLGIKPNQLAVDTMDVHTDLTFKRYIDYQLWDKSPLKTKNKVFI